MSKLAFTFAFVAALFVALHATPSLAADDAPPPPDEPGIKLQLPAARLAPPPLAPDMPEVKVKSPAVATVLSLLGTIVPAAVGIGLFAAEQWAGGFVLTGIAGTLGPSLGHFYADNVGHGFGFFGFRALAGAAGFGWGTMFLLAAFGGSDALMWIGGINFLLVASGLGTLIVFDIATAAR